MPDLAAGTVVEFEPRGAALEMFRRTDREICLSGAAGTGKSVAVLMRLHLSCLNTPGVRALVARKTHASLTASTLVTFRNKVATEALAAGIVKFFGGSAQQPAAFRYSNGSVIVVGGLDRASRLLSTEYDLCFIDEAVEVTEEDLDIIVTRLRHGRLSRQQLLMATNPGAPTHHLKIRADQGRMVMLYSTHEDNPRMHADGEWTDYGREYLERLDSLTGVHYQRMRWGRWVAAEGVVYEQFDPEHHIIDRFVPPIHWSRYWVVDFGYIHAFVCQMWAADEDNRLYLYREIYHTKKTVDVHAKDILRTVAKLPPDVDERLARPSQWIWHEPKPRMLVCDHDAEGRAVLDRDLGMGSIAATKGVTDGIQVVQQRLRKQGDGRARIFFMRDAVVQRDRELVEAKKPSCTIEELPGYIWHQPNGTTIKAKEVPVKDMDDGMDAMRYICAELDKSRPNVRSMSGR